MQLCFFGAYFLVSLPAGRVVRRIGYPKGVVAGLVVAAVGCTLFYPASRGPFPLFLFALFVLASGITILQVAANPYVTALGPGETASRRLTLTQAFNSLGTAIAPVLGGMLILAGSGAGSDPVAAKAPSPPAQAAVVQGPYLALAGALLVLAVMFALVKLPAIQEAVAVERVSQSIFSPGTWQWAWLPSSCMSAPK